MKVLVRMETLQRAEEEEERLLHETRGVFRNEGKACRLTYLLDGIHHEMLIDREEQSVTVLRNWSEKGQLRYQSGLKHPVLYETPVGEIELLFHTKSLSMDIPEGDEEAELSLSYEVFQYDSLIMSCELRIAISPLK